MKVGVKMNENNEFKNYVEQILEKHVPTYFVDAEYLQRIISALCSNPECTRREVIMLAYSIGANESETNELLRIKGYKGLYAKQREDAVWKFALKIRLDLLGIINKIFPQDVNET